MKIFKINRWPYFDQEQIKKVQEILISGNINYWTGSEGKKFESEFADFCGSEYAIALANGSLALSAAYLSIGIKKGDEVITTPRTFIATASSILLLGAKPVFADVDLDSGNITSETILPLINKKTKAISVVHLGGWPAEMAKISDLASSYNIALIEDCSQAHGAEIFNKKVGSFGDAGVWSFCQEKIVSTGGEGGMITTSDKNIWQKSWSIKDHGKSYERMKIQQENSSSFKWVHQSLGSNFRLTEMQSAIGRIQLKKLPDWLSKREKNAIFLAKNLKDLNSLRIPLPPNHIKHSWYKFYVYLEEKSLLEDWSRDRIIKEINSLGYPAFSGSCSEVYLEECFQIRSVGPTKRLANAKLLGETSLMFLVHPTITNEQIEKYKNAIKKIIKQATR